MVEFTIDYDVDDTILAHDLLSMRLRRLAVADTVFGPSKEIIVLDAHIHFNVDKLFKAP